MPAATTIPVNAPCALTLRPVAARVVSYGRSTTLAQRATLYVLRVTRGRSEWFVARRFSEFRALDRALRDALVSTPCPQCRELARRVDDITFPSRFIVRSRFAASRDKIESARLQQLDAFVQMLMETTQGLLATQDDDEESEEDDGLCGVDDTREDRCDALRIVRAFLLVHDHLDDVTSGDTKPTTPSRRPRLGSNNSLGGTTTTFRVQELDVMYRPTSPLTTWAALGGSSRDLTTKITSPNVLDDDELDELFLADYKSPAEDAVIHRQVEADSDAFGAHSPAAVHMLRRAESLRMSRRL